MSSAHLPRSRHVRHLVRRVPGSDDERQIDIFESVLRCPDGMACMRPLSCPHRDGCWREQNPPPR